MAGATFPMLPGVVLAVLPQKFIYKSISIGSGFGGRSAPVIGRAVRTARKVPSAPGEVR